MVGLPSTVVFRRYWARLSKPMSVSPDLPRTPSFPSACVANVDMSSDVAAPLDVDGNPILMLGLYSPLVCVPRVVGPTTI